MVRFSSRRTGEDLHGPALGPDRFGRPPNRGPVEPAWLFVRRHRKEIVGRIAYWTGEGTSAVRAFADFIAQRAETLGLRVRGLEASTLVELTAFGTAVMMNYRYTDALDGTPPREGAQ